MIGRKLDSLTVKLKKTTKKLKKRKNVLFVCTGNTCRSAMAEQIFKNYLREKKLIGKYVVESAGLYVTEPHGGMNILARQALKAAEIKFTRHVPTQLDIVSASEAYRVICMEQMHKDMIVKAVGNLPCIKTMNEITNRGDIEDPYGSDFTKYTDTAKKLVAMCELILDDLEKTQEQPAPTLAQED